jgi:hypothetical protein
MYLNHSVMTQYSMQSMYLNDAVKLYDDGQDTPMTRTVHTIRLCTLRQYELVTYV